MKRKIDEENNNNNNNTVTDRIEVFEAVKPDIVTLDTNKNNNLIEQRISNEEVNNNILRIQEIKRIKLENNIYSNISIREACDIVILYSLTLLLPEDKILVRWIVGTELTDNNTIDKEEVVWWPCCIKLFKNDAVEMENNKDNQGRTIWILEYDELKTFKKVSTRVVFESNKRIIHLDYEYISLRFRKINDLEPTEDDETYEDYLFNKIDHKKDYLKSTSGQIEYSTSQNHNSSESANLDLQDYTNNQDDYNSHDSPNHQDQIDETKEYTLDDILNEEIDPNEMNNIMTIYSTLPHEKKINLALGYRKFADDFIEYLKNKSNTNQSSYTITIDDIREFTASIGLDTDILDKDNDSE